LFPKAACALQNIRRQFRQFRTFAFLQFDVRDDGCALAALPRRDQRLVKPAVVAIAALAGNGTSFPISPLTAH